MITGVATRSRHHLPRLANGPTVAPFLVALVLLTVVNSATNDLKQEQTSEFWFNLGRQDLEEALWRRPIEGRAKNVVLLLGDGLGIAAVTAGRVMKGQKLGQSGEEGYLSFDRLPNVALLKTYNVDKQVPDSAATATAYLSGVKTNFYTMGVTAAVKKDDCAASRDPAHRAHSIIKWAQLQGKETGIVTNTRITHATPGAAYAATAQRDWECDAAIKKVGKPEALLCKDIAQQLLEDSPGRGIKVILGGGRQAMGAQSPNSTSSSCKRLDGRNLAKEWQEMRQAEGVSYAYVTDKQELERVNVDNTDFIMGLFSDNHLEYEINRNDGPHGEPSLTQMATTAIKRLLRSDNGFVLLIEGGRIDHALHNGKPQLALEEVVEFDHTVRTVLDMVDIKETLVIIMADHSHGLTINGYPERGNDILGTAFYEDGVTDGMEHTTLMFATGPGYSYNWDGQNVSRRNVTGVDTHSQDFMFQAAVPTKPGWSMHSGEDVAVFAAGPWAHLFHRVHEQSYVAHVIGYSAAIGPYADDGDRPSPGRLCEQPSPTGSQLNRSAHSKATVITVVFLACLASIF